ncbi:MAG: hypothetical protein AYK19_08460 [Theionarchaea archaeon DG-70-1]|nr:MAG: hypothetical protein AYK19_08460 [Theionarchaea archaeon DG-70-1]
MVGVECGVGGLTSILPWNNKLTKQVLCVAKKESEESTIDFLKFYVIKLSNLSCNLQCFQNL